MYDLTVDGDESRRIRASDMKIGDIGTVIGTDRDYIDEKVLCVHNGIVSLTNPKRTWTGSKPKFLIRLLKPGRKVILEIRGEE